MRRLLLLLIVASLIASCSSTVNAVPTPTPTDIGLSVATQRLEAQAGMAVANGVQAASLVAVLLSSLGAFATGPAPATAPVCKNGVEVTIVPITPEKFAATIGLFYDPACRTLLARAQLTVLAFPGTSLAVTGTQTTYDRAGKAVGYGTISNATTLGTTTKAVTRGTLATSPSGPPVLSFGLTCTYASANACGFGGIVALGGQNQLGVTASIENFVASGSVNDGTVRVHGYTSSSASLRLAQGSGIYWTVGGGTLAASLTGTFTENVDPKAFAVDGSLALNDALLNATTTLTFGTRSGIGHGAVAETSSGKTYARFATNPVGGGTIHYSDGTSGNITLFIVTS